MRNKMFGIYLEQTMVRTNHARLYEPVQILNDHQTVKDMHQEGTRSEDVLAN
jgi:hypothetical protein